MFRQILQSDQDQGPQHAMQFFTVFSGMGSENQSSPHIF